MMLKQMKRNNKTCKRGQAILAVIALILTLSCFPTFVDAAETPDLTISTAEQWLDFAATVNSGADKYSNKLVVLEADIDLGGSAEATTPMVGYYKQVGFSSTENDFEGDFDGQGHTISGVYIDNTDGNGGNYSGLFCYGYGISIRNLTVEGTVKGGGYSGGIIGRMIGGSEMENCVANVDVTGSGSYVGGIVGEFSGDMKKVGHEGNVNASKGQQIGGIAGSFSSNYSSGGAFESCYNSGSVLGGTYVGGLIGRSYGGYSYLVKMSDCYNLATVTSDGATPTGTGYIETEIVGGLVGYDYGYDMHMKNCYNAGRVSGTDTVTYRGGLVGQVRAGSLNYFDNNYYQDDTAAGGYGVANNETDYNTDAAITRADLKADAFLAKIGPAFKGDSPQYPIKDGYPLLTWEKGKTVAAVGDNEYLTFVEAVAAAENGDTVKLLQSAVGEGVSINKKITIDLNGYTYTAKSEVKATAELTLENGILKAESGVSPLLTVEAKVTIVNRGALIAEGTALKVGAGGEASYDTTAANTGDIDAADGDVTITNIKFKGEWKRENGNITISDGLFVADPTDYLAPGLVAADTAESGYRYMVGKGSEVGVAAVISGGKRHQYPKLADAMDNAKDGDTVELIRKVRLDTPLVITKQIVFNGKGIEMISDIVDGNAITLEKDGAEIRDLNLTANRAEYVLASVGKDTLLRDCDIVGGTKATILTNNNVTIKDTSLTHGATATAYVQYALAANAVAIPSLTMDEVKVADATSRGKPQIVVEENDLKAAAALADISWSDKPTTVVEAINERLNGSHLRLDPDAETIRAIPGGMVTYVIQPEDAGSVNYDTYYAQESYGVGASISITDSWFTASPGYRYVSDAADSVVVTNDTTGEVIPNTSSYGRSYTMPASNITISVNFKKQHRINFASTPDGSILAIGNPNYSYKAEEIEQAPAGSTVGIVANATDENKEVDQITVTDSDGNVLPLSEKKLGTSGTYNYAVPCFTMADSDVRVKVTFKQKGAHTVTASAVGGYNPGGSVSTDLKTANPGDTVKILLSPDTGKELNELKVKDGDDNEITVSNQSFTMPASNVTVTASFKDVLYDITVAESDHGSIEADNENQVYGSGYNSVKITATPEEGYELEKLIVTDADDNDITASYSSYNDSWSFYMPAADVTVKAIFKKISYTITTKNLQCGGLSAPKTAHMNDEITVDVLPEEGYELEKIIVTDADDNEITVEGNKFTMPAKDVTVSATFRPGQYTVKVAESDHGAVTADKTTNILFGEDVTLNITAEDDYEVDKISVMDENDNAIEVSGNSFKMPAADVTVTVTFKKIVTAKKINIVTPVNGEVTADKTEAPAGDTVTLTITADEGYEPDTITVKDESENEIAVAENKFMMPDSDVTVTVTFKKIIIPAKPKKINIVTPVNGEVTADKTEAPAGDTVTLTITADEGYETDTITVKDESENEIAVAENKFMMPDSDVTVTVTFKKKADNPCNGGDTCPSKKFTDVDQTKWYHEAIDYAITRNLFNGTSATTFEPNTAMSRGMLVTVLYRLDGEPAVGNTAPFTDLTQNWYKNAVIWATENNITKGMSATKFSPDTKVTREQTASFLKRYADYKSIDTSATTSLTAFSDQGEISSWAKEDMAWAVAVGMLKGTTSTKLSPRGNATRAEVATILMRFKENIVK